MPRAGFVAAAHQARDELSRTESRLQVELLDGFALRARVSIDLPLSAQRVVAFLALHDRPLLRLHVAGVLWPETSEDRAFASLRTALWRVRRSGCNLVQATDRQLELAPEVSVDAREAADFAHRVVHGEIEDDDEGLAGLLFTGELLPDWYDDWVLLERERIRQLHLHALETVCERLTAATRFAEAVEAGLAAVAGEPLRESAHRALVKAYLAEGNRGEAVRQYSIFRELLNDHLGLAPSGEMENLVRGLPCTPQAQ